MTVGSGKRQYRACQRCRRRKTRCDLSSIGEFGKTPCLDCFRTGQECILASSRRGGDFSQYRKSRKSQPAESAVPQDDSQSTSANSPAPASPQRREFQSEEDDPESDPFDEELRNPSDALQILTRSTDRKSTTEGESPNATTGSVGSLGPQRPIDGHRHESRNSVNQLENSIGIKDYALVAKGFLRPAEVQEMVQVYAANYHPFLPIVPDRILAPQNIDRVAREEAFLLTIILTIASKDDFELNIIHHHCCQHIKPLLLDVLLALPSTFAVGTVEGLLILSEWLPYLSFNSITPAESARGSFPEDSTAWSLIGQAIRHAYLLRLDRMSFYDGLSEEKKRRVERERIAWTFVYLADRQISVRMGQSFWSRGASLSTKLTIKDFSALRPRSLDDTDDYSSIHLATMELTQLLHNVHDIMYSSRQRTLSMIFAGDYNRYLDDFHKGVQVWHASWDGLAISPKLKSTLTLLREYLNLYANSFSFQAVVTRSSRRTASNQSKKKLTRQDMFPSGVMASPDGRYIHDAVRSAKCILQTFNSMEPDKHVRYIPFRYYLYGIYAAVFLFKAEAFGALSGEEEAREVLKLIKGFVTVMSKAAVSEHHVGWRYSQLLMALCSNHQSSKRLTNQGAIATTGTVPTENRIVNMEQGSSTPLTSGQNRHADGNFVTRTSQLHNSLSADDPASTGESAPFQLTDFNFSLSDPSWMNMSFDTSQNLNFLNMESPFALNEMWGVPQFDEGMQLY